MLFSCVSPQRLFLTFFLLLLCSSVRLPPSLFRVTHTFLGKCIFKFYAVPSCWEAASSVINCVIAYIRRLFFVSKKKGEGTGRSITGTIVNKLVCYHFGFFVSCFDNCFRFYFIFACISWLQ